MSTTQTTTKEKVKPKVLIPQDSTGMEEKSVATREPAGALATLPELADQEILNSDIIIPKILLMQGLSDFVADRKAQIGDIVRSTNAEKVGDDKKPISFIPLKLINSWTIGEIVNDKFEFRRMEPRNAKNEDLEWEFVEKGTDWKRQKTITVLALLPSDITDFAKEIESAEKSGEALDLEKTLMPVAISFKVMSYKAGQAVATFFTKVKSNLQYNKNVAPYKYELALSCEQVENDKGKFMVWKVGASKPISKELLDEAGKWYKILNSTASIKIDVSDEGGGTEGAKVEVDVSSVSKF